MREKRKKISGVILFLFLCIEFLLIPGFADESITSVSINPSTTSVCINETFTIDVFCQPAQPIKAFEFSVLFDTSYLQVIEVVEGNIFQEYSTFFIEGTIDNSAGVISSIYGLIIGPGSVSDSGTLVSITFTSMNNPGESNVILSDVGITNETNYIPVTISNGSVISNDIFPSIEDVSIGQSTPYDTDASYGWCRFQCTVNDNDIDQVYHQLTYPDGSVVNKSMNSMSSSEFSLNLSGLTHGAYSFLISACDTDGNWNSTDSFSFLLPPNWDISVDGFVDIIDLLMISNHYAESGSAGWIREDVDNDGIVSISDFLFVSNRYNWDW